jgi:hypothetical protein
MHVHSTDVHDVKLDSGILISFFYFIIIKKKEEERSNVRRYYYRWRKSYDLILLVKKISCCLRVTLLFTQLTYICSFTTYNHRSTRKNQMYVSIENSSFFFIWQNVMTLSFIHSGIYTIEKRRSTPPFF